MENQTDTRTSRRAASTARAQKTYNLRIDPDLKAHAQTDLAAAGLSFSSAAKLLQQEIVRTQSVPFELRNAGAQRPQATAPVERITISLRVNTKLHEEAACVLGALGLNMSAVYRQFLSEIIRTGAVPFDVKL